MMVMLLILNVVPVGSRPNRVIALTMCPRTANRVTYDTFTPKGFDRAQPDLAGSLRARSAATFDLLAKGRRSKTKISKTK